MSRSHRIVSTAALAVVIALNAVAPARAAFPGRNGLIVFSSDRDGDSEIYVMTPDGSATLQLTFNTADDTSPHWSPDGRRIVFASSRDGEPEIFTMDGDGTDQEQLTFNKATDSNPAWSPDGEYIAFTSFRGDFPEIWVMEDDGDEPRQITDMQAPMTNEPSWSPDGTHIVFYSDPDGDFDLYVAAADGSSVGQLTFTVNVNEVQPDWSPDGSKIVFARGPFGTEELETLDDHARRHDRGTADQRPGNRPPALLFTGRRSDRVCERSDRRHRNLAEGTKQLTAPTRDRRRNSPRLAAARR